MKKKAVKRRIRRLFEISEPSVSRWLECKPTCNLEYVPPLDPDQPLYESEDCETAEGREDQ